MEELLKVIKESGIEDALKAFFLFVDKYPERIREAKALVKENRPDTYQRVIDYMKDINNAKEDGDLIRLINHFNQHFGNLTFLLIILRTLRPKDAEKVIGWIREAHEDITAGIA